MKELPRHLHYLAASFGLTALAALIRWVADPFLADTGHYIPFYLAVAAVATMFLAGIAEHAAVHDLTAAEDRAESDQLNSELHAGARHRIEYEKRDKCGAGRRACRSSR